MNSEFKKIVSETNKAGYQSSSLLLLIIVCLISAILYWAAVTELDKVIRGDGKTVSDLENQLIQTSESGVLIKRYFEEGDFVSRGDILFDIDPIDARTEYEQAVEKSIRLQIQQHRLISESKNVEPNFKKFESNNLKVFIQNQVDLYYAKKTDLKQNILILE